MDEFNETSATEVTESDDWDDVDLSDVPGIEDLISSGVEATPESEAEADQPEAEPEEQPQSTTEVTPNQTDTAAAPAQKTETDVFTLKHLDEVKSVNRDEVVVLAQKGMDYDRIKQKQSELEAKLAEPREGESFVAELAKAQGLSVSDFIDQTRAAQIAQKDGIDQATALARVKLERRERELAAREAKLTANKTEQSEADVSRAKIKSDADAFTAAFPTVDIGTVPQAVWELVSKGESLVNAYTRHENAEVKRKLAELELKLETAQKNNDNKTKSAGSRTTVGNKPQRDKLFDGWDD